MKLSRAGFFAMLLLSPLAAGVFSIQPLAAQAADPANSSSCAITSADLNAVTAAAAEGLLAELAARRALLIRTIKCAQADAQSLINNLNGVSMNGDAATIQSQLSGKLVDAMNYYNIELGKVPSAGIAGTQAIAKETLAWRQSNYDPLAAQVANFMLWADNQNLFTTGVARLHSIESIVALVEQGGPNNDLQTDLASAQAFLVAATNENAAAKNAFLQSLPPDQTLALIQESLQSLSNAYQKFFDVSTIVQKLLPTK